MGLYKADQVMVLYPFAGVGETDRLHTNDYREIVFKVNGSHYDFVDPLCIDRQEVRKSSLPVLFKDGGHGIHIHLLLPDNMVIQDYDEAESCRPIALARNVVQTI